MTVDEYILQYPLEVQDILRTLRCVICEAAAYKTSKGTIQFPLDKPLPYELIKKIVAARVRENNKKNTNKENERGSV